VLAVLTSALLAVVFLARAAERLGQHDLVAWFRRRGLILGVVTGAVALAGVAVLAIDAPTLFDGLTGWALPIVRGSGVAGLATLWMLRTARLALTRISAVASVALIVATAAEASRVLPMNSARQRIASSSCAHARSHRRHASAHTAQCFMPVSACSSQWSPHDLHTCTQASSWPRVTAAS
jgi:cytochrome d ubiquinol oxidase subunit II